MDLFGYIFAEPSQICCHFCTGCCFGKITDINTDAVEHTVHICPDYVVLSPDAVVILRNHREDYIIRPFLVCRITVEDRHNLFAGQVVQRTEGIVAVTVHNAVGRCPVYSVSVPFTSGNISEVNRTVSN